MILLLICTANFAVLHCKGEEIAKKEAESKAGDLLELTIKDIKWRFHWCPAGEFKMGSPLEEANRGNNEQQHWVKLSQGFWMGETEVTQEQWKSIMGKDKNPSEFKGEKLPVERVSWNDCQEFVKKLNVLLPNAILAPAPAVRKNLKAALPTEAQWEYACRAGSTTAYCFGDDEKGLGEYCWYKGNKTLEVGTKNSNAWGLYDMHGNVWEWCNDWYGSYPSGAASAPVIDPVGALPGDKLVERVRRGGSWWHAANYCRSAYRGNSPDGTTGDYLGVRVALVSGFKKN